MQTTLRAWSQHRAEMLADDNASAAFIRGYLDAANGRPIDFDLFAGEPFSADDYHGGYGLAKYEVGPVEMDTVLTADGRVLTRAA